MSGADTGYIYSLDAVTGCVYWSFNAGHAVRTAMTVGPVKVRGSSGFALFFGDRQANVYAIDARTGRKLWTAKPEKEFTARVTAAPTYYDGRLYVPISSYEEFSASTDSWECCKSLGGVAALDANTGRTRWLRHVTPELPKPTHRNSQGVQQWGPAGGAVWNSPTIDPARHAVYFGTGDATTYPAIDTSDSVMPWTWTPARCCGPTRYSRAIPSSSAAGRNRARRTVRRRWVRIGISPASPVLKTLSDGTSRIIVVTKPGDVLALDPDNGGAPVWRVNATAPVFGNRLPNPGERAPPGFLWGIAVGDDAMYFGLTRGGMGAIDLKSGQRLWLNPLESQNGAGYGSATSAFPGVALQGSSDGRLQAVSTTDGKLLWSYETRRDFDTVNGVKAHGGSINAQGPVVADGMVLVGVGVSRSSVARPAMCWWRFRSSEASMKTQLITAAMLAGFSMVALAQKPSSAFERGSSLQASQDPRLPGIVAKCRNPPTLRPPRGGPATAANSAAPAVPDLPATTAIPGVLAAGQAWKVVWSWEGNNVDGPIASDDGTILFANNDASNVMKLDPATGLATVVYDKTNNRRCGIRAARMARCSWRCAASVAASSSSSRSAGCS